MIDWYAAQNRVEAQGFQHICGIDEAGRGPLAGPVCAAAVILPVNCRIDGLNDSKKLSAKKRELLFDLIMEQAVCCHIAWASEREIDEKNILQATLIAMRRAVEGLEIPADYALVDGNRMPVLNIPGETIVKGDGKCACIAAASILAKVSRDRFLVELDKRYPQYGFARHKGYGTKEHYAAIRQFGILPVHRRSFLKNLHET